MKRRKVVLGLKSKTGKAIAVALSGPASSPQFCRREELAIYDMGKPLTIQPYHQVMELPLNEWASAMRPAIKVIEEIAVDALARFIESLESPVGEIAIVGPNDRVLERIGNPHIRAHAAEGVLYRHVLEVAAKANGCRFRSFPDAASELGRRPNQVQKVLTALGKAAGSPWRSDEKSAAMAAWSVLPA
jgi:hypothetical protein